MPTAVLITLTQSIDLILAIRLLVPTLLELKKSGIVLVKNVIKKFLILIQTLDTVVFTVSNQSEKAEPKADRRAFSRAHKLSSPLTSLLKKLDRASFSRLPKSPRFLITGSKNRLILSQVLRSVSDVLIYSVIPLTQSLTFAIASGILPTKSLMPWPIFVRMPGLLIFPQSLSIQMETCFRALTITPRTVVMIEPIL